MDVKRSHSAAGRSIAEMIREELDKAEDEGFRRGLATAIAIFQNPYSPDVEAVLAEAEMRQLL